MSQSTKQAAHSWVVRTFIATNASDVQSSGTTVRRVNCIVHGVAPRRLNSDWAASSV